MSMKYKIGYGKSTSLQEAITNETIDAGDVVFTSDTEEVAFIKPDNTPMYAKARTKEAIKVNGVTGLGIANGQTIPVGKSLDEVIKMLVQKAIPATYTAPKITLTNNGGQAAGAVEAGTSVTPKLRAAFTKNDAGNLTSIKIKKGTEEVSTGATATHDYTGSAVVVGDNTLSFTAEAAYAEGAIKTDNLGNQPPNGHITAGTITSSPYTITGQRNLFYGTGVGNAPSLTSDAIRALTNKRLNPTAGMSFTINVAVGQQYVVIAYKDTLRDLNKVHYVEGNDPNLAANFVKSTVQVADARGGSNGLVGYKAYVLQLSTPAKATMTLNVTI